MSDLAGVYRQIKKVRKGLSAIPDDLERREREIREDENLTTEAQRIKLRQVRDELRRKQQQLHDELVQICARADKLALEAATEGGSRQAHERVRKMFDARLSTDTMIKRAEELGDADVIRAIRADVLYLGGEDGFVDPASTVTACNEALARLGSMDAERIVEIGKERQPTVAIDEFAAKHVHGTATAFDRIAVGYAVTDAEGDDA